MKTLKRLCEEIAPVGVNGFCILKPEFLKYEDEFCTLLNTNDWKIVKKVKKTLSKDEAEQLYLPKKDESFYQSLCDYMSSGDSLCCSCSKKCDDPIKDMSNLKDKVRKQWGEDEMKNAMHSSDSLENVERESKICLEGICESHIENNETNDGKYQIDEDSLEQFKLVGLKPEDLINKLKDAFCEEMNAWYQYTIITPFLKGKERTAIQADYIENANEELEHAMWLLERINQLGGDITGIEAPDLWNTVATHKYIVPMNTDVVSSLQQMVKAETGAISTYVALELFTRDIDVVTNCKVKEILADEQKHLQEMKEFLDDINEQN